jgi:HEAT repeat protein
MSRAASSCPLLIAAVAVLVVGAAWLLGRRAARPSRPAPPAPAAPSADVAARIQELVGQLGTDTDSALDGLVALGEPGVPALVAALNTPDDDRRMRIVEVFEHTRSPAAVAPLLSLLQSAPSDVRIDAITALGAIADRRAAPPLQDRYARDDSPQVRYAALASLGRIGQNARCCSTPRAPAISTASGGDRCPCISCRRWRRDTAVRLLTIPAPTRRRPACLRPS